MSEVATEEVTIKLSYYTDEFVERNMIGMQSLKKQNNK